MKRLFNNTIFTSIDTFTIVVLNLLATPILIKNFGIEGYGVFVFLSIFSIYGMLNFFDLGMESALVYYVARFDTAGDRRKLQDTLSISLAYYGFIGSILGVVLYLSAGLIASRFIDENAALDQASVLTSISYISVNVFLQFLALPFSAVLEGMRRFAVTKSINSVMNILRYFLIAAVAIIFHRIDIAFLIILILTLIRLGVYLFIYTFKLPQFQHLRVRLDLSLLRMLISYSSLLFINRIVGLIFNQIDKLLIWLYLAIGSMTVYDVVSRPAQLLRLTLGVLVSAVIPETARLFHLNDFAAIRKLYVNLVRYAYILILPMFVFIAVHIHDLLTIWVGRELAASSQLVLILLSCYLLIPIASISLTIIIGMEKVKRTLWISIASAVVNAVLSIAFVKPYGVAGLLSATLSAEIVNAFSFLYMMLKILNMRFVEVAKPLLRIASLTLIFSGIHLTIRAATTDNCYLTVALAGAIFILNYYVNYRYLLDDKERLFLMERIKSFKTRIASGVSDR